jgi:hypothetical protein
MLRNKYLVMLIVSFVGWYISCADAKKPESDNRQNPVTIGPSEVPVPKKLSPPTGPKVKITAYLNAPDFKGDKDFYISEDCENLIIGGMPLNVNNVRGLEQLKKVKRLIL